jgi:hypothetical protein
VKISSEEAHTMEHAKQVSEEVADPSFADFERDVAAHEERLRKVFDDRSIYRFAAQQLLENAQQRTQLEEYADLLSQSQRFLEMLAVEQTVLVDEQKLAIAELMDTGTNLAVTALKRGVDMARQRAREVNAKGGRSRWTNDPRTNEKLLVKTCWMEWQTDQARYKSKAAFARDVLQKCEHLSSQKQIEDWCREWEKTEAR